MFSARLTAMLDSKKRRGVGVTQGDLPLSHFLLSPQCLPQELSFLPSPIFLGDKIKDGGHGY